MTDVRPRLLILNHFADLGGGELALLRSIPTLREAFDVRAAVPGPGPLVDRLRTIGVPVFDLAVGAATLPNHQLRRIAGAIRLVSGSGRYASALRHEYRIWRPDLIYVNSLKAAVYGQALAVALRRPWVWHIRDRLEVGYLGKGAVRALRTLAGTGPRLIIANSAGTSDLLPPRGRRKAVVVPSPVDIDAFAASRERRTGTPTESLLIAVIGRLTPIKGQHLVIDALGTVAASRNVRLRLIGGDLTAEGGQEKALRHRAESAGLAGRIEFTGHVDDVARHLDDVDVVVSFPLYPEPFGQAVVQAMAAGLPVVAAAEGGPKETIIDGLNGILVPPRNVAALAAALLELAADPQRRTKIGDAAASSVDRYSADIVLPQVKALLVSAADRHNSSH